MYRADEARYDKMSYKRCGNSGILLPRVSLGMWQNFGAEKPLFEQKEIIFKAFRSGKQLRCAEYRNGRGKFWKDLSGGSEALPGTDPGIYQGGL